MGLSSFAMAVAAAVSASSAPPPSAGHAIGVGGIFVRSPDPARLARWYRDVLGIRLEPWGGALLRYDAPGHPPVAVWNAFPPTSKQFAPSAREFMINFTVDDLDAMMKRLGNKGVPIIDREEDDNGRFASILDPDGTKIELWQPKR